MKTKTNTISKPVLVRTELSKLAKITLLADEFTRMAKHELDSFAADFAKDPHHAFSWGDKALRAAAKKRVGDELVEYLTKVRANNPTWLDDQVADCIVSEFNADMVRKARWPEHSTSALSNTIAVEVTACKAEFIARMSGL